MFKLIRLIAPLAVAAAVLLLAPPGSAQAGVYEAQSHTAVAVSATVASGDTAWGIAAVRCGNGALHQRLTIRSAAGVLRANHDLIWPTDRVSGYCAGPVQAAPVARSSSWGWVAPLPGGLNCVSGWGATRPGHTHKGVDLPKPSGTPIRAAHAGTVSLVRWQAYGAGWYEVINHGAYQTVYMHQRSRPPLRVGTRVSAGQVIGYVGSTGHSTGPHLHFEVHHGAWHPINPAPFLRARGVPIRGC